MKAFPERTPAERTAARAVDTLLEGQWWPKGIKPGSALERIEDDCDGDAWILTNGTGMLRFRSFSGGGMSSRVRNALLLLAEAMRRDEEARPQTSRSSGDEDGAR